MASELAELQARLLSAIKSSGERSYGRRQPRKRSIPLLERSIEELERFVADHGGEAAGWDLLSLAYECLLRYPLSIAALKRAIELRGRANNRELKRLARLQEYAKDWKGVGLSPAELDELRIHLEDVVEFTSKSPGGEPLQHTTNWLQEHAPDRWEEVIRLLAAAGYHSDFSILFNLCRG